MSCFSAWLVAYWLGITIAACYLSPEGVVLGADSTTTVSRSEKKEDYYHFHYGQKILELGEDSTLGIANWRLISLGSTSYRTLIGKLGDDLSKSPPNSVIDVAWRWNTLFWSEYCSVYATVRQRAQELDAKGTQRTADENKELRELWQSSSGGFCVGGYCKPGRKPEAYECWFRPEQIAPATPQALPIGVPRFWAWSNMIERITLGIDEGLYNAILASGKWSGSAKELQDLIVQQGLSPPRALPIREAIDWVHSSIYTTIKAIKFSKSAPVCGGPIEIAVITSDRKFRWVRHKSFDAALD